MAKYLVIVESPAKVKTIKKFLGANYEVDASNGHVRDLPKSQLGIDTANDYEPKYITIRGKGDILAKLRKEVKKADVVYLATDPDREGEAISWHLMKALKLDYEECREGIIEDSPEAGHKSGGRPADQKDSGPHGGLHDQPASVGEGEERVKRRPGAVRRPSDDL